MPRIATNKWALYIGNRIKKTLFSEGSFCLPLWRRSSRCFPLQKDSNGPMGCGTRTLLWPNSRQSFSCSGLNFNICLYLSITSFLKKRTSYDFLPTAAMCSISGSACGTVRGYDEFVAHNIDVVTERRLYRKWSEFGDNVKGMLRARRLLNGRI